MRKKISFLVFAVIFELYAQCCAAQFGGNDEIRSYVEQYIRPQYEDTISGLMQLPNAKTVDASVLQTATDGMKGMFYNKAYNIYRCMKQEEKQPSSRSTGDRLTHVLECSQAPNRELAKGFKLITDYGEVIQGNPKGTVGCFAKSRIFEGELDFPPFDFLKQANGRNDLYDYSVLSILA